MDGPARPHRRWRRALLFGVAMLVPCAVLVMLGLRTIEDERRREDERLASAREALADRTRQQLLAELETLKFRQMSHVIAHEGRIDLPPLAPVAFAGALRDGALLLPWEHAPAAAAFKTALESGSFAERLSKAETLQRQGQTMRPAVGSHEFVRGKRRNIDAGFLERRRCQAIAGVTDDLTGLSRDGVDAHEAAFAQYAFVKMF
jgi:hypothetical protein